MSVHEWVLTTERDSVTAIVRVDVRLGEAVSVARESCTVGLDELLMEGVKTSVCVPDFDRCVAVKSSLRERVKLSARVWVGVSVGGGVTVLVSVILDSVVVFVKDMDWVSSSDAVYDTHIVVVVDLLRVGVEGTDGVNVMEAERVLVLEGDAVQVAVWLLVRVVLLRSVPVAVGVCVGLELPLWLSGAVIIDRVRDCDCVTVAVDEDEDEGVRLPGVAVTVLV